MNHAKNVRLIFDQMGVHGVSMDDLELYDHVSSRDDLAVSPDEAFTKMIESDFVMDSGDSTHYYQATADYISEEMNKRGLLNSGEWRVVIEAVDGSDEYLYEFEADNREEAIQKAYREALDDGLKAGALWTAKTVEAI